MKLRVQKIKKFIAVLLSVIMIAGVLPPFMPHVGTVAVYAVTSPGGIVVAMWGSDSGDGSQANPLATIQAAVNLANTRRAAGQGSQTVYIREGIYFQKFEVVASRHNPTGRNRPVSTDPAFLTVRNFPGETAVLDGSLFAQLADDGAPDGVISREIPFNWGPMTSIVSYRYNQAMPLSQNPMVRISDSDYIRVEGLTIQNHAPFKFGGTVPGGILVESGNWGQHLEGQAMSTGVQILNNTIIGMDGDTFGHGEPYPFTRRNPLTDSGFTAGANGAAIQVLGRTAGEYAFTNILIEGNEVAYTRPGWTENVVLAGNVNGFEIRHNFIHNNQNIGLNMIGNWQWIMNLWGSGDLNPFRPDNRVRNGIVEGNVILNSIGYGNPAYASDGGASGIYVDGARDIIIRYNFVSGSSCAFSAGTEPTWTTVNELARNITLHDNILVNSRQGAVLIGGTTGSRDMYMFNNTMIGRQTVAGAAGNTNNVININSGGGSAGIPAWMGWQVPPELSAYIGVTQATRQRNTNFNFHNNIIVSLADNIAFFGGSTHGTAPIVGTYTTMVGNVLYGRALANPLPNVPGAMDDNIRATTSPLAGLQFVSGGGVGNYNDNITNFARTNAADAPNFVPNWTPGNFVPDSFTEVGTAPAGANPEAMQNAMASARLPLFDIAMADYRGLVDVLPEARAIFAHLGSAGVRGTPAAPITPTHLQNAGYRNIARYFESRVRNDGISNRDIIVGILHNAYGYTASAYGVGTNLGVGHPAVRPTFYHTNTYRGIISYGFGNEGDINWDMIAQRGNWPCDRTNLRTNQGTGLLQTPTGGSGTQGTPFAGPNPGFWATNNLRHFVRIPYYNPVSGRTSYLIRGFNGVGENPNHGAFFGVTAACFATANNDNPSVRWVCADTGSNANPGSNALPWATVNHALGQIHPGDTLHLRGQFDENVVVPISASGNRNFPTRIESWAGSSQPAIIDGGGSGAGITLLNVDNIIINDLIIQNAEQGIVVENLPSTATSNPTAIARSELRQFQSSWWALRNMSATRNTVDFTQQGAGMLGNIAITNNEIRNINSAEGFAILAYGHNSFAPITNVIIENNTVWGNRIGDGASVYVGGNIHGFTIAHNTIRNINGTAISVTGTDNMFNFASHGMVYNNFIYGVSTINNSADDAFGILIDGAGFVDITNNLVFDASAGLHVSNEVSAIRQNNNVDPAVSGAGGFAMPAWSGASRQRSMGGFFWGDTMHVDYWTIGGPAPGERLPFPAVGVQSIGTYWLRYERELRNLWWQEDAWAFPTAFANMVQSQFDSAYVEMGDAIDYLEDAEFDFVEMDVTNLNEYLTARLYAQGFQNAEVVYILEMVQTTVTGCTMVDTSLAATGNNAILLPSLGRNEHDIANGEINQADLDAIIDADINSEWTFLVELIVRYGDYSWRSVMVEVVIVAILNDNDVLVTDVDLYQNAVLVTDTVITLATQVTTGLTAVITPANATNQDVTWSYSVLTGAPQITGLPVGTTADLALSLNTGITTGSALIIVTTADGGHAAAVELVICDETVVLSNDARLASISVTPHTLSPAFALGVNNYAVSVGNDVDSINISATVFCPYAVIVSGTGTRSLTVGQNIITVVVQAQDGTLRTYTITVTRAYPSVTPPSSPSSSTPGPIIRPRPRPVPPVEYVQDQQATTGYDTGDNLLDITENTAVLLADGTLLARYGTVAVYVPGTYDGVIITGRMVNAIADAGGTLSLRWNRFTASFTADQLYSLNAGENAEIVIMLRKSQSPIIAARRAQLISFDELNEFLLDEIVQISVSIDGARVYLDNQRLYQVSAYVGDLELTASQKAQFSGIIFDYALGTFRNLGGRFSEDGRYFVFYSLGAGVHGIVVSDNLIRVYFNIGVPVVAVNDVPRAMEVEPVIISNRTYVPLRFVGEAFGAYLGWHGQNAPITIELDGRHLQLEIGQPLPAGMGTPFITNGRTMVPIRYVAETLGAHVVWEGLTRTVRIYW